MRACPRCGFKDALLVPEAASRLGVSDQTVRNWLKAGRLPGVETEAVPGGFRYWIPIDAIEAIEAETAA